MDKRSFGRRLYQVRKAKKITSSEMANILGLTPSFVRQIECGNRSPSIDTLIDVCNLLNISPDYLLEGDLKIMATDEVTKIEEGLSSLPPQDLQLCNQIVSVFCANAARRKGAHRQKGDGAEKKTKSRK